MTKDGKENRFGKFVFEDEQAERVAAGDMSAVWEFMAANEKYIYNWARSFIFKRLTHFQNNYYDAQEYVQQIYVDFIYYKFEDEKTIACGIYRSFLCLHFGGVQCKHRKSPQYYTSLDVPLKVSMRGGEKSDGATLGELLPSRDPLPFDVIANREHVKKIAPYIFRQLADVFKIDLKHLDKRIKTEKEERAEITADTSIYDLLQYRAHRKTSFEQFQEVIEEIFYGLTFEEVKKYAQIEDQRFITRNKKSSKIEWWREEYNGEISEGVEYARKKKA